MKTMILLLAAACLCQAAPRRSWLASIGALLVTNAADAHSSWGAPERNPVLRSADGRFRHRAIGIKIGIVSGLVIGQALLIRKRPDAARPCAAINFAAAGVFGGVAIRNYRTVD